uniref:DUF4939 domain-containing protein n=1 Tax=Sinocyclocheilus rhinocerous TaxID=307959 RepID=A0A673MIH0_9TELE
MLSQIHQPHQPHQPPTPVHNHQITNYEHLMSLTGALYLFPHLSITLTGLVTYLTSSVTEDQSFKTEVKIYGLKLAMEAQRPITLDPFTELVQALRESIQPPPIMPSTSACPMAKPTTYSGEAAACSGFLLQCSLYFELQPHQFVNDRAKIAFIMSLLSGRALQWAEALWNSRSPLVRSYDAFVDHFREVFGKTTSAVSVHDELFRLRQANMSIWNETALLSVFQRGLNSSIRQQMSVYEDTVGLESFLQKVLHISQHLIACHTEDSSSAATSPSNAPTAPEPMQTNRYHLSTTERARRVTQGLCMYCGSQEHLLPFCPIHPTHSAVSMVHIHPGVYLAG